MSNYKQNLRKPDGSYVDRFTLTEQHLSLMRRANIRWNDDAYEGSPEVDLKRPYGNGHVVRDVAEILGYEWDWEEELPEELYNELFVWHREMEYALQVVLAVQSFEPGVYETPRYRYNGWTKVQ